MTPAEAAALSARIDELDVQVKSLAEAVAKLATTSMAMAAALEPIIDQHYGKSQSLGGLWVPPGNA